MDAEKLYSESIIGKEIVGIDSIFTPISKYKFYWNYYVLLYKMGDLYCLYFGKHLEEKLIGRFTDSEIIAVLTDRDISNFKEPSVNSWRLHICCDILAECIVLNNDERKWYSLFMMYVLLKLTPEIVKKISWTVPGFDGLYKWSVENDLINSLNNLSGRSSAFGTCYVEDAFSKRFGKIFNPNRWLCAGISNSEFEKILKGYGEMSYVNLEEEGVDLFSGSITTLPLVWDMRYLRNVYHDAITADWYIVGIHENCMLYWPDFMQLIIDRKNEFIKSDKTVKTVNVKIVIDPSAKGQFDRICKFLNTDIKYEDLPKKELKRIDCDNGSSLIWLPVCLTDYFEEVYSYGGDSMFAGSIDINKYIKSRDHVLDIMSPSNKIYHAAEKNITVSGFYRYDGRIYCETVLGLVRLPDTIQNDPDCVFMEEWSGNKQFLHHILCSKRISMVATLDKMISMNTSNQLPW